MSYITEVQTESDFITNVVIEISGRKFSKYNPDSGLTVPFEDRIVSTASFNPTQINLRQSANTIDSINLTILDEDGTFSAFIGQDEAAIVGQEIKVWLGRVKAPFNGTFDWADYQLVNQYIIKSNKKSGGFYKLKANSQVNKTKTSIFRQRGNLDATITDIQTSITAETEDDFFDLQGSGHIKIEDEFMVFTAATYAAGVTTFTVVRPALNSTAVAHATGATVQFVYKVEENPIDILIKLLVSGSGDLSVWDAYPDGAAIDSSLLDITSMTAIRDSFFAGETFRFYFYDVQDLLKDIIEPELLQGCNIRLIENAADNKISIAILDQSDITAAVEELNESNTFPKPSWQSDDNEIETSVKVHYAWSEGLQDYTRERTFDDTDAIAKYGPKRVRTMEFKGMQADLNGNNLAADRGLRYLERFSTPRTTVSCTSFMSTSLYNIGDKVLVSSSELPQEGGGLGMSSVLEIMSKGINFTTGLVKYNLRFTSYTNLRRGAISPSPLISAAPAQNRITVPDGTCYEVGYKLKLWNNLTGLYTTDPVNTVLEIIGNDLIFENDWTTVLPSSNLYLFFADYDESSDLQLAKYAYIAPNTDFFADGTKAYQIVI